MEFDKSKILTVVTADQAKVGMKGWVSNDIPSLKIYIERGDEPKRLQSVDFHNEHPFRESYPSDGSFACKYRYFYPAPEPPYVERQAEWVKENGVKEGTRVRFTKNFNKKGLTGTISRIRDTYLIVSHDSIVGVNWCVSFTSLEVIKEPTYRPFKNAEEFKPYREKWCLGNMNGRFKIDWHNDTHIYEYGDSFITWEEAFSKYKFEDGTPFGIKEQS